MLFVSSALIVSSFGSTFVQKKKNVVIIEFSRTFLKFLMKKENPFLEVALKTKTLPQDLEELVLDHANLKQISPGDLSLFQNLKYLFLTNNKLTKLENLETNMRLISIDARNNEISSFDFSHNFFITELFLADNNLRNVENIVQMLIPIRELQVLDLRNNLVTKERGYRRYISQKIPSLKILDGIEIKPISPQKNLLKPEIIDRSTYQRKSKNLLDYLSNQPLSEPDRIVEQKTAKIRKKNEKKERMRIEAEHEEALKQKEIYERAAQMRTVPLPDFLKEFSDDPEPTKPVILSTNPQIKRRASTRMYLKASSFQISKEKDKLLSTFNPTLASLHCQPRLLKQEIIYPTHLC